MTRAIELNQLAHQFFGQNRRHQMVLRVHHHQRHFGFTLTFISLNQLSLYPMRFAGKMLRLPHFFICIGEITGFSAVQRFVAQAALLASINNNAHHLLF